MTSSATTAPSRTALSVRIGRTMVAPVAATTAMLIGLTVLVGWVVGSETLTAIVPGLIIMIPNTATGIVLAGLALWLLLMDGAHPTPAPAARTVANLFAGSVLLLGLLTFIERVQGANFGIDLLLFPQAVQRYPYLPPGQMATNSTVSFMLAGAALLTVDWETARGTRPSQWLACAGLGVSLIALVGYLYGTPALYSVDRAAGMALITALAFAALHTGILFARPERGVVGLLTGDDLGSVVARRLLPALIVVPIAMGWLWNQAREIELFSRQGGIAFFVVFTIVCLVAVMLQSARVLRSLDLEREALLARETEARGEAEAANTVKSQFLATMSHELRTPLNAVIGYTGLLRDGIAGTLTEQQQRYLERVGLSARHLLTLIDEVLALARLEAGKEDLAIEPVRVERAIDEASTLIEPLAAAKGLAFHVSCDAPALELHTDAAKLRQILVNLLSNAIKFTRAGSVTLAVVAGDAHVHFIVTDTGIGIAPEFREKIFEPFWQVERTADRRAPGTGLGLSVSRHLARLLGGDIAVESTPGEGSRFELRVPLGAAPPRVMPETPVALDERAIQRA